MAHDDIGDDNKNFSKNMDIYGDDVAVTAVGGLFSDSPQSAGESAGKDSLDDEGIVDVRGDAPHGSAARKPPAREYKVREYFSEKDDLSAEDEPVADPVPAADKDAAPRPETPSVVPPVAKRSAFSPESEDYSDYIRMTSRQIAEDKKKKGGVRNGFGGESHDTGFIRDASRNPAIRKERVQNADSDGYEDNPPAPGRNLASPRPEAERPRAKGPVYPDGKPRTNPSTPPRAADANAERSHERNYERAYDTSNVRGGDADGESGAGRGEPHRPAAKPATKYPVSATGKLPVKGNVPKRSEYFEPEGRSAEGGDILRGFADLRIILGGVSLLLFIVLIFLFVQNMSLRAEIKSSDDSSADLAAAIAENATLRITNEGLSGTITYLESELVYYKDLATANAGNSGQQPQGNTNLGSAGNPMPTQPPTAGAFEYEVVKGDTLYGLAKRFYGDEARYIEIKNYNHLQKDGLDIGQKLMIPQ